MDFTEISELDNLIKGFYSGRRYNLFKRPRSVLELELLSPQMEAHETQSIFYVQKNL